MTTISLAPQSISARGSHNNYSIHHLTKKPWFLFCSHLRWNTPGCSHCLCWSCLQYCDISHTRVEENAKYSNNSLTAVRHMDFLSAYPKTEMGNSCQAGKLCLTKSCESSSIIPREYHLLQIKFKPYVSSQHTLFQYWKIPLLYFSSPSLVIEIITHQYLSYIITRRDLIWFKASLP